MLNSKMLTESEIYAKREEIAKLERSIEHSQKALKFWISAEPGDWKAKYDMIANHGKEMARCADEIKHLLLIIAYLENMIK